MQLFSSHIIWIFAESWYILKRKCPHERTLVEHWSHHPQITLFYTDEVDLSVYRQSKSIVRKPDTILFIDSGWFSSRMAPIVKQVVELFPNAFRVALIDDLFYYPNHSPEFDLMHASLGFCQMDSLTSQLELDFPDIIFDTLPSPFVDTTVFYDRNMRHRWDILIYGSLEYTKHTIPINPIDPIEENPNSDPINFYAFRNRIAQLLLSRGISERCWRIHHIPCSDGSWSHEIPCGLQLAEFIGQSKLALATRTRIDKCMKKYLEISACGTGILGNIPTHYTDILQGVELNPTMSDDEILAVISRALAPDEFHHTQERSKDVGRRVRQTWSIQRHSTQELLTTLHRVYNAYLYKSSPDSFRGESPHYSWIQHLSGCAPQYEYKKDAILGIDVGANIGGYFDMMMSMCMSKKTRILAYEPNPVNFHALYKRAVSMPYIEVFECALSDENGLMPLQVYHEQGGNYPGNTLAGLRGGGATIAHVPVYTLDDHLEKHGMSNNPITYMKIDTEGNDTKVLYGAQKALQRTRYIVFECSDCLDDNRGPGELEPMKRCVQWLDKQGFVVYRIGKNAMLQVNGIMWHSIYERLKFHSNCFAARKDDPWIQDILESYIIETID